MGGRSALKVAVKIGTHRCTEHRILRAAIIKLQGQLFVLKRTDLKCVFAINGA